MPSRSNEGQSGNTEPLLSVSVDVPVEGGDVGGGELGGARTVQEAFYRNPREAIKWLESEGEYMPSCMSSTPKALCTRA